MFIKREISITDLESYVFNQISKSIAELSVPDTTDYLATALKPVAQVIRDYPDDKPICIIGDYDCDGLMSLAEFTTIMRALKKTFKITVPKRFSEGYGFSEKILERIPAGALVICVDNGINAVRTIDRAKERGMQVIIMDHHKNDGQVPNADIIIDPIYDMTGFDYKYYCGAGLTCKLAEILIGDQIYAYNQVLAYAAIATIADVVPLTGDNRKIVKKGLDIINAGMGSPGLQYLISMLHGEVLEASDIAFKIAPAINAPGRLVDNGGELILRCVLALHDFEVHATAIKNYNNQRQRLTKEACENATVIGTNISYSRIDGLCEGLCGIVANKIAQSTHRPAFVTTLTDNNVIKGSARAFDDESVHSIMSAARDSLLSFGGHEKAAGLALTPENENAVIAAMDAAAAGLVRFNSEDFLYDLEIDYNGVPDVFHTLNSIKPFGAGLRNPVLKVNIPVINPSFIGSDSNTMRVVDRAITFIGFGMAEKYRELGQPARLNLYGRFAINHYKGRTTPQFIFEAIE